MKLLFIGEGRHDIGDPNPNASQPRTAQGTVPTLARRICPVIAPESAALAWTEIRRFNPSAQKRGYPAKIAAAVLVAARKLGCKRPVNDLRAQRGAVDVPRAHDLTQGEVFRVEVGGGADGLVPSPDVIRAGNPARGVVD